MASSSSSPSSSSTEKKVSSSPSSSSSTEKKVIVLISQDGEAFNVEEAAALLSQTVKNMVDEDCTAGGIPLPNVDSATLAKVIEFCKGHVAAADEKEKDLQTFESEFVDSVKDDMPKLFNLVLAANYLNIKQLLDLTCQAVADMIKDMTPEEVRNKFNIKNDFTPEEEEEIRRDNAWAYE